MNSEALVTIAFGLIFVAVGLYIYFDSGRFAATAREASGVVADVVKVTEGRRKAIHPIVRFKTVAGQEIVFTNPVHYFAAIGVTLPVSYNPANPNEAKVGSVAGVRRSSFVWLVMCLVFGGLVCLMGLHIQFGLSNLPGLFKLWLGGRST